MLELLVSLAPILDAPAIVCITLPLIWSLTPLLVLDIVSGIVVAVVWLLTTAAEAAAAAAAAVVAANELVAAKVAAVAVVAAAAYILGRVYVHPTACPRFDPKTLPHLHWLPPAGFAVASVANVLLSAAAVAADVDADDDPAAASSAPSSSFTA